MSYRTQAMDTSLRGDIRQVVAWRLMSPAEKIESFVAMQRDVIELAELGIRRRHPNASPREVFLRRAALTLGRETVIRVYGFDPEPAGD